MALDRDDKILKKITKLPSKKQFGDLAYSWLKERFPDYPMELLSYTDKGTGWEVRVRLAKVHLVPVLSDGFNILISDRDVLIHLIQKP